MKLVARTPAPGLLEYRFWHLLVEGEAHYLYVKCEQSFVSFVIMVQLTPEEYVEYHALGWFLQYMAEKINHWPSGYSARRVGNDLQVAAEAVIADYTQDTSKRQELVHRLAYKIWASWGLPSPSSPNKLPSTVGGRMSSKTLDSKSDTMRVPGSPYNP